MQLQGASTMANCSVEFQLTNLDFYTATVPSRPAAPGQEEHSDAGFTFVMITTAGAAGTG